jgi:hypothetical protein
MYVLFQYTADADTFIGEYYDIFVENFIVHFSTCDVDSEGLHYMLRSCDLSNGT